MLVNSEKCCVFDVYAVVVITVWHVCVFYLSLGQLVQVWCIKCWLNSAVLPTAQKVWQVCKGLRKAFVKENAKLINCPT